MKDVTSYSVNFYYKTKNDDQLSFHDIGEYNSIDWKKLHIMHIKKSIQKESKERSK